jgi:hypothetical protein
MPHVLRVKNPNGEPIGMTDFQEGIKRVIEGLGIGSRTDGRYWANARA